MAHHGRTFPLVVASPEPLEAMRGGCGRMVRILRQLAFRIRLILLHR